MRLLLDTHALIWWLAGRSELPTSVREAIATSATYVSAASAWEVATKARIGKLPNAGLLAHDFAERVRLEGFLELPITIPHGERAGSLPGPHKDPFDRMLIAQAQAENLVLVSNERAFDGYGIQRLW